MSDDSSTGNPLPRNNPYVLGHDAAEQLFLQAWKNNALHNSWLISGIEGIGKATLAYKFARFVLAADDKQRENYTNLDISPSNQVYKLIAGNAHPDLKIIERDYTDTDRKKVLKAIKDGEQMSAEELGSLKKSAYIRIDDVRTINEFLSKHSSNDGWRVVVIDSIDEMNTASANAVLKILEEPPARTLMLLISHNPNQLLPTIKSRCTKLELKPLTDAHVASLLRRYRPEQSETNIKQITAIASGSIGKALSYVDNNAVQRYQELCQILNSGNKFSISSSLSFAEDAAANEDNYTLSKELILKFLSENIKKASNVLAYADSWDYAVKSFSEVDRLNMDKKQVLINIINNICKNIA